MDAGTGDVRTVEFTSIRLGESALLTELLAQIPPDNTIKTVTANGAYNARRCHGAIVDRSTNGIIPISRSGRVWKGDCPETVAPRNAIIRATRHLDLALWKK